MLKTNLDPKNSWLKVNLGPKNFGAKKLCGPISFGLKTIKVQKNSILAPNKFFVQIRYFPQTDWAQSFRSRQFWSKCFYPQIHSPKKLIRQF